NRAVLETPRRRPPPSIGIAGIKPQERRSEAMITKLGSVSVKVLDQDEALDFYVNKLGLEKAQDTKEGPYRGLPVRFPGDAPGDIQLGEPGPPVHDEAT